MQGLVFSIHNDVVLARDDTRALARAWMVDNIPEGDRVVIEPIAPDQWAMDTGRPSSATGTGNRWNKWPTSRFRGEVIKLEDFERTLRTSLLDRYARAGYCHVVTGSTQYGRALDRARGGARRRSATTTSSSAAPTSSTASARAATSPSTASRSTSRSTAIRSTTSAPGPRS